MQPTCTFWFACKFDVVVVVVAVRVRVLESQFSIARLKTIIMLVVTNARAVSFATTKDRRREIEQKRRVLIWLNKLQLEREIDQKGLLSAC